MSERDQIPLKPSNRYYSVTALVLAKMIRGTALGTTTTSISSLFTLWDKYIAKHWENLTAKKITSWINDRTGNPTAQLHSPEQWADWILCNPDGFDGILDAGTGSHVICDHFEITDKDYLAADGSSVNDGTLTKKWLAEVFTFPFRNLHHSNLSMLTRISTAGCSESTRKARACRSKKH
jgi:hypothetical protein